MAARETPAPLRPFVGSAIPEHLRAQRRWAPWRAVWNEKKRKYDKVPHRADRPEYGISTTKPEQWFSYEVALAAFESNSIFAGVGYVMTGAHGVIGIDLDHCIEDGEIAPWAAEVIAKVDSYTEFSPSGHGLRVLALGDVPQDWNNHEVGIEVYGGNEARFLTVTGDQVPGSLPSLRAPSTDTMAALSARYAKEKRKADVIDLNMPELLDDLLLPDLASMPLRATVKEFLLEGRHSGDRSRAVFAASVALYGAGLSDDEVFSILATNDFAMEIALDHRRQDHDRALLYLWREHCCKGKSRIDASKPLTLDDFEDLGPDPAIMSRDTAPIKEMRFRPLAPVEFLKRKPMRWMIKRLLPRAQVGMLVGESGAGKSFLALDLAGAVTRGADWRGHKVEQGRVLYICAEGASGFRNRIAAYLDYNGLTPEEFDMAVIPDAPNFLEKDDIKDLVKAAKAAGEWDLIIVDTYAQVMPGGDENGATDSGRVLGHCKLLNKVTGAMVLIVHHTGKDSSRGARGWSGMKGAMDVEIMVERGAADYREVRVTKMKDGEGEGDKYGFSLHTVALGQDEDGEAITSCVVSATERRASTPLVAATGPHQHAVMSAFETMEDLGGEIEIEKLVANVVAQVAPGLDGKTPKNAARDAKRAIRALIDKGLLVEIGEILARP